MSWQSITKNEIEDVKADKKSAKSVEKYMVSENAIYFEGKYLPISDIREVTIHDSVYSPHCCCGRGIPVKKLKIEYGDENPLLLMLEKDKNAQKMADMISEYRKAK